MFQERNLRLQTLSRRSLLSRMALLAAAYISLSPILRQGFLETVYKPAERILLPPFADYNNTWKAARLSNPDFAEAYPDLIKKTHFGATFCPRQLEYSIKNDNLGVKRLNDETERLLMIMTNDLGIRKVRLPIRMSEVIKKDGKVNLNLYRKILDFIITHDIELHLNAGGIKAARWTEQHIPEFVLEMLKSIPDFGSEISPDSELGKISLENLEKFLYFLSQEYGKDLQKVTKVFQPDNEPFHIFGIFGYTVNEDFLEEVLKISRRYFPDSDILVNSAGTLDLNRMTGFFNRLKDKYPAYTGKLIAGVNYYYQIAGFNDLSLIGEYDSLTYAKLFQEFPFGEELTGFLKKLARLPRLSDQNPETYIKKLRENNIAQYLAGARTGNYRTIISELQMEGWPIIPGKENYPGNSSAGLKLAHLRTAGNLIDPNTDEINEMLWGIEGLLIRILYDKCTQEQKLMTEYLTLVNYTA